MATQAKPFFEAIAEPAKTRPVSNDNRTWRVSRTELERRWDLVRAHMRETGLDAIIVQGYEEKTGGNVRWLTDVPPGYPRYVIVHRDDHLTLIDHGPNGDIRRLDDKDVNRPGIGEVIFNSSLYGGNYTHSMGANSVAGVLQGRNYTNVGLVGEGMMPFAFVDGLKSTCAGVRFTDETDFFDSAKANKSAEEIELIRAVAKTQDVVFDKLLNWIEPGVRDFEINAFIDYQLQLLGAERGAYIGVSAPMGTPAPFNYRAMQGRTMREGDHTNLLLESNGLGGVWTELGRMVSFGKLPTETVEAHQVCVEAQAYTAKLSVPGAHPAEIFEKFNTFMVERGSEPERRLFSHGQGYDMVERPMIRPDETLLLPEHANMAIHPTYNSKKAFATLCDQYLVGENGGFLHSTPKQVFEL